MNNICPMCEDIREIAIESNFEGTTVKGVTVIAESHFSRCTHCGEEFTTAEQMDVSLTNAYNEYRKVESLVYPKDIVAIREKYNVGQKTFAKILGFGELTINSYEQGKLPTKANSNIIQLVGRTEDFVLLYNQCKHKLSETQQNKIEAQLLKLSDDKDEWEREVDDISRFLNTSPDSGRVNRFSKALAASAVRQNPMSSWIVRRDPSASLQSHSGRANKSLAGRALEQSSKDTIKGAVPRGRG